MRIVKRRIVVVGAVIAIAAAAAYLINSSSRNRRGTVHVSGNIEVIAVEASFKVPGRVKERPVDEGEMVRPGQLIARLDSEDFEHEVSRTRSEAEAMRAVLAELEAGSRPEEIAQARAALARADSEAKRLDTEYRREKALFAKEVIPQRELDTARTAYETSQAAAREAREAFILVRKGPRRERIDQARARLREAEAALALAQTRLGYTTLTATLAGLVLSKNVEPGEQVAAGTPVITVGDINNTWLRAYIAETDLGRVKVGQKAQVTTDTWPGKVYAGRVSFISPEAEFTPKNVQTEKERVKLVYRIKITIPNPQMELKPGMPADAEIILNQK